MDNKAFNSVFRRLRLHGILAKQRYWCCQSCGCNAIVGEYNDLPKEEKDLVIGYVFYHKQDAEHRDKGKDFNLAFGTLGAKEESDIETAVIGSWHSI